MATIVPDRGPQLIDYKWVQNRMIDERVAKCNTFPESTPIYGGKCPVCRQSGHVFQNEIKRFILQQKKEVSSGLTMPSALEDVDSNWMITKVRNQASLYACKQTVRRIDVGKQIGCNMPVN